MHARTVTEAWPGELMIMILPGDRGARAARIPGGPVIYAPVNCRALAEFGPDDGFLD